MSFLFKVGNLLKPSAALCVVGLTQAKRSDEGTSPWKSLLRFIPKVNAKSQNATNVQCNIIEPRAYAYSLYLWINVNGEVNPRSIAKIAADMENLCESVNGPCDDYDEEVLASVGFGPNFYKQVMGPTCRPYYYTPRKGLNGEMPYTPGDIILHARCNKKGKLFDLCKNYIFSFPPGSLTDFEDIYGFEYRRNCDLSGFSMVSNRLDEGGRRCVAIEQETGGSYALAQKWVHDFSVMKHPKELEKFIGRDIETAAELKNKSSSSHVARMRGTTELLASPQYEVVNLSQPYGTLSTDAGSFFISYASDPCSFEFMLDRMVGAGCDSACDDVMKMSTNVKGSYFYFPACHELDHLVNAEEN